MFKTTNFGTSASTSAAQQAYLAIEQQPRDETEAQQLEQLRAYIAGHTDQDDLRELAPAVREVMGEGYQVGCGSSHIWILREGSTERLAIIADQLTTMYRDVTHPQALPAAVPYVTISPVVP